MAEFTDLSKVKFSGKIDSKGRITVPARIRDKLNLEENGERISLSIENTEVIKQEISSESEALEFLSDLENIRSFSFEDGVLEVVLCE